VLDEEVHFPEARAWGRRYLIVEDGAPVRVFVLWDHYFDEAALHALLRANGFAVERIERGLVGHGPEHDVLFVKARRMPGAA
jgi:hypothetical protein